MRAEIREQDENAIYLGIFATDEDKLIGFIALHSFNYINKKLKIGYVLNKKYRKRGFMVTMREDYKLNGTLFKINSYLKMYLI